MVRLRIEPLTDPELGRVIKDERYAVIATI
jgi:hypothetical protein